MKHPPKKIGLLFTFNMSSKKKKKFQVYTALLLQPYAALLFSKYS